MTPEEAYEEALRRIREAEETGAVQLDLRGWNQTAQTPTKLAALNRLPPELERLTSLQSLGCSHISDLSPLAGLTSLQSLDLSVCLELSDLSPLATLTSLQSLNLTFCNQLSGDLSPLAGLTSLQSLNLSRCYRLSGDLSPLARLTALQSLDLRQCEQFSLFTPVESLLPTLKELKLFGCKFEDFPSEVCGKWNENVLDKVRAYYHQRQPAVSPKIVPTQPLGTPPQIFISYAWGNISPNATQEDRQRQEVVERLCQALEQEYWQVVRDKTALKYGDPISDFMKTLSQARFVIVVLSDKYLRSPYCMTELHALYKNARQERQAFLNRIIPLVLADARIGTWRGRATYAKHWEAEFKAMEQDIPHLGEEDLKLYKATRRWHNEVGDMLAFVNDKLSPHGFDEIVKDDFAALRQMLMRRR